MGKHLFEECLQRYLRGKTIILATHQLQYLKNVDNIILIDKGKIQLFSNYLELLDDYPEYQDLLVPEDDETKAEYRPRKTSRQISVSSIKV